MDLRDSYLYSTDGINWVYKKIPYFPNIYDGLEANLLISNVLFVKGLFIIVTSTFYLLYSQDGINWELGKQLDIDSHPPPDADYPVDNPSQVSEPRKIRKYYPMESCIVEDTDNGYFILVVAERWASSHTLYSYVYFSRDLYNWRICKDSNGDVAFINGVVYMGMVYAKGKFVCIPNKARDEDHDATDYNKTPIPCYGIYNKERDDVDWYQTEPFPYTNNGCPMFGNNRFVQFCNNGYNVAVSYDGINWDIYPFPYTNTAYEKWSVYANGKFYSYCICNRPNPTNNKIMHYKIYTTESYDGINWSPIHEVMTRESPHVRRDPNADYVASLNGRMIYGGGKFITLANYVYISASTPGGYLDPPIDDPLWKIFSIVGTVQQQTFPIVNIASPRILNNGSWQTKSIIRGGDSIDTTITYGSVFDTIHNNAFITLGCLEGKKEIDGVPNVSVCVKDILKVPYEPETGNMDYSRLKILDSNALHGTNFRNNQTMAMSDDGNVMVIVASGSLPTKKPGHTGASDPLYHTFSYSNDHGETFKTGYFPIDSSTGAINLSTSGKIKFYDVVYIDGRFVVTTSLPASPITDVYYGVLIYDSTNDTWTAKYGILPKNENNEAIFINRKCIVYKDYLLGVYYNSDSTKPNDKSYIFIGKWTDSNKNNLSWYKYEIENNFDDGRTPELLFIAWQYYIPTYDKYYIYFTRINGGSEPIGGGFIQEYKIKENSLGVPYSEFITYYKAPYFGHITQIKYEPNTQKIYAICDDGIIESYDGITFNLIRHPNNEVIHHHSVICYGKNYNNYMSIINDDTNSSTKYRNYFDIMTYADNGSLALEQNTLTLLKVGSIYTTYDPSILPTYGTWMQITSTNVNNTDTAAAQQALNPGTTEQSITIYYFIRVA